MSCQFLAQPQRKLTVYTFVLDLCMAIYEVWLVWDCHATWKPKIIMWKRSLRKTEMARLRGRDGGKKGKKERWEREKEYDEMMPSHSAGVPSPSHCFTIPVEVQIMKQRWAASALSCLNTLTSRLKRYNVYKLWFLSNYILA